MRSITKTGLYLVWVLPVFVIFAWIAICLADKPQADKATGEKPKSNDHCYVCHPSLKTEEITATHLEMGVTCNECHGPSVEHMHDEMLMTKPDLLFGRSEVDKMCSNPRCHKPGGDRLVYGFADHKDPEAVKAFEKEWSGRTRPNGRAITPDSVCTDCHGRHNLDKPIGTKSEEEQLARWVALFNGRDLAGWKVSGDASWNVESGRIVATPGPKGEGGDLWSEAVYEDYLLAVTFRANWPIHAGIWLRATESQRGPRVEILDQPDANKPPAFTGSVWVPGKGLALVNLREYLLDKEGWNTISVKVEGDRVSVWLNGEEIGTVRTGGPTKGKIGLHIEKHPVAKTGELHVREILIQPLDKTKESDTARVESETPN